MRDLGQALLRAFTSAAVQDPSRMQEKRPPAVSGGQEVIY